jgi:uncharacterized protein YehS (DUF1456 family)
MINNDILRRLRYALNINDTTMLEIFTLAGQAIEPSRLADLLKKEDEKGYAECSDKIMGLFLDGLIVLKRGRKESKPGPPKKPDTPLSNNAVLKKLRIALELQEEDMLGILKLAGIDLSKSELSALFRKEGSRNYKECGDQFLRSFLNGLALRQRA